MDRTELDRMERMIDREVTARFLAGTVQRVALLQPHPDELLVRVFITTQQSLDAWAQAHRAGMRRIRRELSLELPQARLLEFTVDGDQVITMPDDPEFTHAPVPPREAVEIALSQLRASYVFPDRAEQAAAVIEARLAAGEYDDLDEDALAERLTGQLHEICADKHLRVRTMPPHARREPPRPPEPGRPAWHDRIRPGNYGIHRVERLDGNVGYLDLRAVAPPEIAGPAIAAAMELVSGTYALIIDLRRNHGGSPHGVVLWCSYLFDGPDTHLSDIFDAVTGETRQFWSLAHVPGHRYLGRPVYVLTSSETFSGGEDLAYTLQAHGRAEIIGETTGGGAHPTRTLPISDTMAISVPHARSVNPVTGTNWQGTGVVPDVAVPADQACDVAYAKALRHVLTLTVPPPIADEARAALPG
jgi:Peptidase family S41/N-terminal domain of Peptidase_S41 in eukaryotic IRBP